jgi:hypothetical protein
MISLQRCKTFPLPWRGYWKLAAILNEYRRMFGAELVINRENRTLLPSCQRMVNKYSNVISSSNGHYFPATIVSSSQNWQLQKNSQLQSCKFMQNWTAKHRIKNCKLNKFMHIIESRIITVSYTSRILRHGMSIIEVCCKQSTEQSENLRGNH